MERVGDHRLSCRGARLLVALLAALPLAGCRGSRGSDRDFVVLGVNLDRSGTIPINEEIALRFSRDVDPALADPAVFIFVSGSDGLERARGTFRIAGREIRFSPALPVLPDLSDAGLRPDTHYTICVPRAGGACAPGLPGPEQAVRSRSGRPLARSYTATFRTLSGARPFRDPVPGSPAAVGSDPPSGATEVPPGSAKSPTIVTLFWSEPLLPVTVTAENIGLFRRGNPFPILLRRLALEQEGPRGTRVILTPRGGLSCDAEIEVRWTPDVQDLGGNPALPPAEFPRFRTTANCPPVQAIVERFESRDFWDPSPLLPAALAFRPAEWFLQNLPVLRGGYGFGGTGRDGALEVGPGAALDLNTINTMGLYEFTSVRVAQGGRLTTTGQVPVRILSQGDIAIEGTVDLKGGDGANGIAGDTSRPVGGGRGIAAGGNGGIANHFPGGLSVPLQGRGFGPSGNIGCGFGGNDSHPGTSSPWPQRSGCGGGGASYGGLGLNGDTLCANASSSGSLRGNFYGDAGLINLLGGSGGGGGGNAAVITTPPTPFPNSVSHSGGGGGAGGGAVLFECPGTFTLASTGRVWLSGGNAGIGGGPPAGKGGDGGGGSGGGLKVQAVNISLFPTGEVRALGGAGTPGQTTGLGGWGRIRLEDFDGVIGGTSIVQPAPSVGPYNPAGNGRTVAQSLFYDSETPNPNYHFDATDPNTGIVLPGPAEDLEFGVPPGAGQTVRITFQGAPPDPANPERPDPNGASWVPPQPLPTAGVLFATDIRTLSARGLRFIRFRVEFDIGPVRPVEPLPVRVAIETLRIRTAP